MHWRATATNRPMKAGRNEPQQIAALVALVQQGIRGRRKPVRLALVRTQLPTPDR